MLCMYNSVQHGDKKYIGSLFMCNLQKMICMSFEASPIVTALKYNPPTNVDQSAAGDF